MMPEPEQHHNLLPLLPAIKNGIFRETSGTKDIIEVCPGTAIEREINKKMTQKDNFLTKRVAVLDQI